MASGVQLFGGVPLIVGGVPAVDSACCCPPVTQGTCTVGGTTFNFQTPTLVELTMAGWAGSGPAPFRVNCCPLFNGTFELASSLTVLCAWDFNPMTPGHGCATILIDNSVVQCRAKFENVAGVPYWHLTVVIEQQGAPSIFNTFEYRATVPLTLIAGLYYKTTGTFTMSLLSSSLSTFTNCDTFATTVSLAVS